MSKIFAVMRSEYLKAVRSKAFIVGVLITPLLFGGGFIAMLISEQANDVEDRDFAVVDRTGRLYEVLEESAQSRNESSIFEDGEQVGPAWNPSEFVADDADQPAELVLSEKVDDGELVGFVVIGADVFSSDRDGDQEFSWNTETPTYRDLPDWIEGVVNNVIKADRFTQAGLDQELVSQITRWSNLKVLGLTKKNESTGEVIKAEEQNKLATFLVPVVLMMMMFMLVMMSAPALMNNVLEEKMQKIAEVLVSAVSPFELLMGKLLAAVLVSVTLGVLYLGSGLVFVHQVDEVPPQVVAALGPGILAWFSVFLVLALLIYGSMFSALGAACSELQDAQTLMMPAMMLFMIPMFFLGPVIENPGGTLATIFSLIPPFTPLLMLVRVAVPPGVDWWQLALALVLTAGFTTLTVMASGKIFRIGILSQGQTPSYKKLIGWLMSK